MSVYGEWYYGQAAYSDADVSPSAVLADETSSVRIAPAFDLTINADSTVTPTANVVASGSVAVNSRSTSSIFGSLITFSDIDTVTASSTTSVDAQLVHLGECVTESDATVVVEAGIVALGAATLAAQGDVAIIGGKLWDDIADDAESWTPATDTLESWSDVSDTTEIWNEVA